MTKTYLIGVLHDATERKTTYRISQKSRIFVESIASSIRALGGSAWTYKEGKNRSVYIVEFSKTFLEGVTITSEKNVRDYVRGYFDAEGGIAKSSEVRFYIYFAQKDLTDLSRVKKYLEQLNIDCGKTHNPSKKVDPEYWRFYVKTKSHHDFAKTIGSWHPDKSRYLGMKR